MGKTITLDDELLATLEREAERTGMTVEQVLHETVKRGLEKPFVVRPRDLGVKPGVNFDCAWKLLDETELP